MKPRRSVPSARVRRSDMVLWTGGISPAGAQRRHLSSGRGKGSTPPLCVVPAAASPPSKNVKIPVETQRRSPSHADRTPACSQLLKMTHGRRDKADLHFACGDGGSMVVVGLEPPSSASRVPLQHPGDTQQIPAAGRVSVLGEWTGGVLPWTGARWGGDRAASHAGPYHLRRGGRGARNEQLLSLLRPARK